jgi:hypothetical protein
VLTALVWASPLCPFRIAKVKMWNMPVGLEEIAGKIMRIF